MEWISLVIFTVLSEAAAGLVLVYWLFGFTQVAKDEASAYAALGRSTFLVAWLTTGVAMLASLSHLGWPLSAYRALSHLSSSWLSWEVLLTALFAAGGLALWWLSRTQSPPAWAVGADALMGLAAIFASGRIYTLPSIPANAGGFPILLFFGTTLVIGAAGLLLLVTTTKTGRALDPAWTTPLSLLMVGALVLAGALTLAYAGAGASGTPEARQQATFFAGSLWYAPRLVLGLIAPALLALWLSRRPKAPLAGVALSFLLVTSGELIGRFLFFTATVFTGINTGL